MVRDQTIFLTEQFADLDRMLESKQGIVTKYKTLNQSHKKLQNENTELLSELNRLKAAGGKSGAPISSAKDQELVRSR